MRILLVRHGESLGNVDPLAYGRVGDPRIPLTAEGQRQVSGHWRFSGVLLSGPSAGWPHPPPDCRYIDMVTCGTNRRSGNASSASQIRFERHDSLKEQSFGILYREHTRCGTRLKNILRLAAEEYRKNPFEAVPPEGESPAMHYQRVQLFMQKIKDEQGITDRLIVAHGATNRHIITSLLGWPPNTWKHLENQRNGDVTLVQNDGNGFIVRKIYDGVSGTAVDYNPVVRVIPPGGPLP